MRMLVLGAGLQGSACAYDLLRQAEVERVTLADLDPKRLPAFLKKKIGKRLVLARVDVKQTARLRALMRGHDAVMNASPYHFNYAVAKAAAQTGLHCADLGGNTEIVQRQKTLDGAARKKGVSIIPDCGLAPGMVNIIAAEGIRRVGDADSVKIFVGGLPQHPEPPLNYQIVYSLEGALDYYTTPSWVLRDGQPRAWTRFPRSSRWSSLRPSAHSRRSTREAVSRRCRGPMPAGFAAWNTRRCGTRATWRSCGRSASWVCSR